MTTFLICAASLIVATAPSFLMYLIARSQRILAQARLRRARAATKLQQILLEEERRAWNADGG
jgi:hypothetical protein